jgi:hypothetical protein
MIIGFSILNVRIEVLSLIIWRGDLLSGSAEGVKTQAATVARESSRCPAKLDPPWTFSTMHNSYLHQWGTEWWWEFHTKYCRVDLAFSQVRDTHQAHPSHGVSAPCHYCYFSASLVKFCDDGMIPTFMSLGAGVFGKPEVVS